MKLLSTPLKSLEPPLRFALFCVCVCVCVCVCEGNTRVLTVVTPTVSVKTEVRRKKCSLQK